MTKKIHTDLEITGSLTVGGQPVAGGSGIPDTLLDAKGDLIVASAPDTAARLAAGTDGQVLVADAAETTGLKWADPDAISDPVSASGGAQSSDADFYWHSFNASGSFNVTVAGTVEYLIVGGGGGGSGGFTSGGGSGGSVTAGNAEVAIGTYSITVGTGGAASTAGIASSFDTFGSASGGAAGIESGLGGTGGGGTTATDMNGANGVMTTIRGTVEYFGGGGGAGGNPTGGNGGLGGGGHGRSESLGGSDMTSGTANTGGGGGGGYVSGSGSGGSGVVILRYAKRVASSAVPTGGATGQVLKKSSAVDYETSWGDEAGIPETIIDAKGDIVVGSAADTAARLAAGTNGQVLTVDSGEATGVKWAPAPAPPAVLAYGRSGVVAVLTGTSRIYNPTATTMNVVSLRASVSAAPTGADIIVNLRKNGSTTIGTATITASTFTSGRITLSGQTIADGDYLTVDITQIGSTIPGTDLTVQTEVSP